MLSRRRFVLPYGSVERWYQRYCFEVIAEHLLKYFHRFSETDVSCSYLIDILKFIPEEVGSMLF